MTDYSELVGNSIVASVIQSNEEEFKDFVARAVRSSDDLNQAAAKVENYVTDVIWDVLYGLEDYEPIAYSLAYEGKLSLDYEGYGDDLYNVVKAYAAEHSSKSLRSGKTAPRKAPAKKPASRSCASKSKSKAPSKKAPVKKAAPRRR